MNCIEHNDRSAVSTCANCGAGLCNDCVNGSIFKNDNNQAFCRKCNYEIACENDRNFNVGLKTKKIIMYIYGGAVIFGLMVFIIRKITGYSTQSSVFIMLVIWACGSIADFFNKDSKIRGFLGQIGSGIKNAINSGPLFIGSILGVALGTVLGVLIMGVFSPFIIVAYLIGINKVKKQIENNNVILSQFQVENDQKD